WRAAALVDDNALVDRAAAVRAGLGWYGKNSNVLIPGAGSWFVLGSVVTDAPLLTPTSEQGLGDGLVFGRRFAASGKQIAAQRANSPAKAATTTGGDTGKGAPTLTPGPVPDGCGTCRRCIDACPTGALSHDEPGHLDARKCLAWLVQAPGVFPREYRIPLHDRIYGCDDCQEVCPVNKLAARRQPPPAAADDAQTTVDVLAMLAAKDGDLLDSLGRWYIPSRDPKYLRRNALIVLGNTGDPTAPEVRTAVEAAITRRDPIIRAHAVWAAARLGYRDLIPDRDEDPQVQEEIEAATSVPATAR
ncbi:MAG TPA: 4Fe-4S double cluster binding domain-containing protein, partial [Acidimicrobiales bacterium]|nr:4Fe-4S double cluster binding domain-containing protein [Acidimicrobiales bacterium]